MRTILVTGRVGFIRSAGSGSAEVTCEYKAILLTENDANYLEKQRPWASTTANNRGAVW